MSAPTSRPPPTPPSSPPRPSPPSFNQPPSPSESPPSPDSPPSTTPPHPSFESPRPDASFSLFSRNIYRYSRIRSKHIISNEDNPSYVLVTEICDGDGAAIPNVPLEMDKTFREHEHDDQDFGGARMNVRRTETLRGEVNASHRNAESVERRNLGSSHRSRARSEGVGCVGSQVKAAEEEIARSYKVWVLAGQAIHYHCNNRSYSYSVFSRSLADQSRQQGYVAKRKSRQQSLKN
nr:hypothetical protein BHM03_00054446 [Ipomoea batatas]